MTNDELYNRFLNMHNLTDKQVGEWFGYKSRQSWHGAPRREKVIAGIVKVIQTVESRADGKKSPDQGNS